MNSITFDYPRMVREALRQVPREALIEVAEHGLPERHHFFISFRPDYPGVEIADHLRDSYPEEMTIVLKTQFEELVVDDEWFSVKLFFSGMPQVVRVPFEALISFVDPSASFGLRFEDEPEADQETRAAELGGDGEADEPKDADTEEASVGAKVISIDKFRRK